MSRETGFPTVWLSRCSTEKERAEFREYLQNCRKLFDELRYILEKEEDRISSNEADYDNGAWAYKQAHCNGMREVLSRVKKLIP